jgi:hypothetical protein
VSGDKRADEQQQAEPAHNVFIIDEDQSTP